MSTKRNSVSHKKKKNSVAEGEEKKDDEKKNDKKDKTPFHKKSKSVVYPKIFKNTFPEQLKTINPNEKPKFCGRELGERVDLSKKVDPEKERLKAEAARAKYLASLKSEANLPADLQKRTKILLKGLYVEDLVYIKKFRIPVFLRIDKDILTQQQIMHEIRNSYLDYNFQAFRESFQEEANKTFADSREEFQGQLDKIHAILAG